MYALVMKSIREADVFHASTMPSGINKLLFGFSDVALEELYNDLPSMRAIQRAIDLILGSQLPNLPAYRMNSSEHINIKWQVEK